MIGISPAFRDVVGLIGKIARCDAPVLIEGETGTGKELAARAIHYQSARREGPFIPVNCGAIPDSLIENELFGHRRGAFTDAGGDCAGLISHGQHGTIFFDEVDALTPKAQVTLLRFLQDQQYRPLGGPQEKHADVRVLAASNVDLAGLSESGGFRRDLLYRLEIMHLHMPPLRERDGDALLLAEHFLTQCAARFGSGEKQLDYSTRSWFGTYAWPGNVRELENLICREYLLADAPVVVIAPPGTRTRGRNLHPYPDGEAGTLDFSRAKAHAIAEFERLYLLRVIAATRGNVTRAAVMAGKERRAFGKLLKKHGIDKQRYCG
jgi:DNA-binding NtrC family response regulator